MKRMMRLVCGVVVAMCLCLLLACGRESKNQVTLSDAERKGIHERLLNARSLRCELGPGYAGGWEGGAFKVERAEWRKQDVVAFDSIDLAKSTARMIGNNSAENVTVFATAAGLTFIERTAGGWVTVLTVFSVPASNGEELACVYSRHTSLGNDTVSSQYHGTCKILSP